MNQNTFSFFQGTHILTKIIFECENENIAQEFIVIFWIHIVGDTKW